MNLVLPDFRKMFFFWHVCCLNFGKLSYGWQFYWLALGYLII
jgi:hypothetical protein